MKTSKVIKGISGNLLVNTIVNNDWRSDWQKIDQENDDGIDGIIHIRKKGELTGEVIYVQIKTGDGYKVETKSRPNTIGIQLNEKYISSHKPRWKILKGAVILIFVDDAGYAYWTDLKSDESYTTENKSIIQVNRQNRFGSHSKGHFKKIAGFFPEDRTLKTLTISKQEIGFIRINEPIKKFASDFYSKWRNSPRAERDNKVLGEIIINRVGWRHISRKSRGYDKTIQSWMLLSVAKKIITEVDKFYEYRKSTIFLENDLGYRINSFYSLRAKVLFPNRQETIVQVVIRGYKNFNKDKNIIEEKNWFYSVYEPRRGINIQ